MKLPKSVPGKNIDLCPKDINGIEYFRVKNTDDNNYYCIEKKKSLTQRGRRKTNRKILGKYLPSSLSKNDKKKQLKSILNKTNRPKISSYKSKRSQWVVKFEKKYKTSIIDQQFINNNILKKQGIKEILDKGMAAYYSSGSRPNQTKESWAFARLASVIMGGKARNVDINIWNKYRV